MKDAKYKHAIEWMASNGSSKKKTPVIISHSPFWKVNLLNQLIGQTA